LSTTILKESEFKVIDRVGAKKAEKLLKQAKAAHEPLLHQPELSEPIP
jgi:hypothetical protein